MMNKFTVAVQFLVDPKDGFDAEGGYSNDPQDPGGETKYGIAKRSHPDVDIKNLTLEGAMDLYYKEYWVPNNLESYNLPMGIVLLDSFVQHSPGKVRQFLKAVDIKGGDWRRIIEYRREYYLTLIKVRPTDIKYKNGWMNRLNNLAKYVDIAVQAS